MTYTAVIKQNGATHIYAMTDGIDLGDVHGPNWVQKHIRVKGTAEISVHIEFCPDTVGDRFEAWVQTGDIGNLARNAAGLEKAPSPTNVDPYTIEFFRDAVSISGPISVPTHLWHAGFVWETAPRPRIKSNADLIAAKLVAPYKLDPTLAQPDFDFDHNTPIAYDGPMSLAGFFVRAEGTTGERPELDLFTEVDARYLLRGTQKDWDAVVATAHAANSMPNKWFDEARGGLPSVLEWPNLNTYSGGANGLPNFPRDDYYGSPAIGMDAAHKPNMSYVHFLSTGSIWSLRNLHANINEIYTETTYFHGIDGQGHQYAIVFPGQTRGVAWDIRDLVHAIIATRIAESWGPLPKGWYTEADLTKMLDQTIYWLTEVYMKNPKPGGTVFHAMTNVGAIAPWQQWGYLLTALNEGVYLGFEQLRPLMEWNTHGPMEWFKRFPAFFAPYYLPISTVESTCDPSQVSLEQYIYPDFETAGIAMFKNDIAAYDAKGQTGTITQANFDKLMADRTNGGYLIQTYVEYALQVFSAMRFSALNGAPGALETAEGMKVYVQNAGVMLSRWSFASEAVPLSNPPPVQPPASEPTPPVNQPGVKKMLLQGSTHTLSVANLKDANGVSHDLPAGTFPVFSASPPEAVSALSTVDPSTGKATVTISNTYSGPVSFQATYEYADGNSIAFNPANETVAAPEDKTGDVVIDG